MSIIIQSVVKDFTVVIKFWYIFYSLSLLMRKDPSHNLIDNPMVKHFWLIWIFFRLLKPKGGQNDINDKLQELIKLREDLLKPKEKVLEDEPPHSDYIPRRLRPKPIPFEDSNLEVRIEH